MNNIKKLKFGLAFFVAFTTTIALIRPAITFENTICGLKEHTHTESCYEIIEETIIDQLIDCSYDSLGVHVHDLDCYNEDNELICGMADYMIHEHDESCFNENNELICPLPEIKEHSHDASCYDLDDNLICEKEENIEHKHDNLCLDEDGNLICGYLQLEKHVHDDNCITKTERVFEDKQLICELPEHIHIEDCYEKEENTNIICGKEEHTHDTSCYSENNELICGKEEHVHNSDCLENKELTYQGEDYIVCVQYGKDANLPEGTELIVHEVEEESEEYQSYLEQVKNSLDDSKKISFARLLDIEFQYNGEKIEPSADVSVVITYLDTSLNENIQYQTIHFKEDGNEILDTQTIQNEDGSASFYHLQNGFSPVMTIGTEDETPIDTTVQNNDRVSNITSQSHQITYKVYQDGNWVTVKTEDTYNAGTITGNNCALISSTKAAEVFGSYGYSATENPIGHFGYSYDDLYNIEYSNTSGQGQNCFMSVAGVEEYKAVQLSTTNNNDYQLFRLLAGSDGRTLISPYGTNGKSGLYVNLSGNTGTNGNKLQLYHVGAGDHASEWNVLDGGNGTIRFETRDYANYFIDLSGGTIANGSQLQVWQNGGATYWKLNKIEKIINSTVFAQNEDNTYTIGLTPDATGNIVCYYWPSSEKTINIEAINTLDDNANAILVNLHSKNIGNYNLGTYFNKTDEELSGYYAIRIEKHNNVYQVKQVGQANHDFGVLVDDSYIVLIKMDVKNQYFIPSVGDSVDVEFLNGANKNSTQNYNNGTIYAKLDFSVSSQTKDPKNNASKLTIVQSADTRDLIEVNLYDYGENINDLYNADHKYPGFQQNEGTYFFAADTYLKQAHFNLGDNITSDLNAGNTQVTRQGGAINDIDSVGSINRPITGAMQSTLGTDGYPALSDGTSLGYLFSNNTYATKKNSQSINGLFQYNETTGAYTFNSRENHAQFNASNDTFTLYDQILSSNAMMYPFGNFLPFNDIVQQSAQSSIIDRDYLISIMNSAQQKGEINLDGITNYQTNPKPSENRYSRLAKQLKKFIEYMDSETGNTNWTADDLVKKYFNISNIPTNALTNELLNRVYTIDFDEPTDFYFGMEMKMNFMQPKNGLTGKDGQQPMEFYFTGDDDVWVYIDGKLVLDLSGIHRHVGGKIDFVNGTVSYYELSKSTGDVGTTPYKTVSFASLGLETDSQGRLKDYSTHSFNFYYMERGSGSGVCRMNFNFPLLKKNSISVSKELSVDNQSLEEVLGNPNFKFQILKENGTDLFINPNTSYDIQDTDGNVLGQSQTDENGIFTLKAGQTAVFKDIDENSGKYFVRELLNPDEFSQYGTISVDGSSQTSNYDVTIGSDSFKGVNSPIKDMSDGSTYFHFNNSITFNKLGKLSITKELESNDVSNHKEFKFKVTLDGILIPAGTTYKVGNETKTVTEEGMISLKPNETAIISNLLAGSTYTVEEMDSDGYEVSYKVDGSFYNGVPTGIIKTNDTITVEVHNKEKSSSVNIPVYKKLSNPDGKEHEYQFDLVQVTDQTGNTEVSDGTKNSITIKIPASSSQEYSETFTINYTHSQIDASPKDFFYKITETRLVNKEMATTFDSSIYVVKVTVTKDEKGNLDASITDVLKNTDSTNKILFVNTITEYELPETGGPGDWGYIGSGIGLIMIAGYFLITRRIHGKEDISS